MKFKVGDYFCYPMTDGYVRKITDTINDMYYFDIFDRENLMFINHTYVHSSYVDAWGILDKRTIWNQQLKELLNVV